MKIAMFGTFDIGNFGDLFFPIIAEQKLSELGPVTITRFSYRAKSHATWCYDVEPIQRFPELADQFDLVIVGGGHLLHFNRHMALDYMPTDPTIPHPLGFWWLPAVAAAMAGIPAALHGVSADPAFPRWATPLLKAFTDSLDYVSVRDPKTHALLSKYAQPGQEIAIVPDSVFSVSDVLKRGAPSAAFKAFSEEIGLEPNYLIIQPSHALRRFKPEILNLAADAERRGWQVLELPIGYEIGNDIGFYGDVPGLKRVRSWPQPMLLAEIIANAQAVAGISLHLSVVASAYGVPVYRTPYADTSKFILLRDLPNIRFLTDDAPLVGWSDAEPDLTVVQEHKARLDKHWRRISELARGPKRTPKARGWELLCDAPAAFRGTRDLSDSVAELKGDLHRQAQGMRYRLSKKA